MAIYLFCFALVVQRVATALQKRDSFDTMSLKKLLSERTILLLKTDPNSFIYETFIFNAIYDSQRDKDDKELLVKFLNSAKSRWDLLQRINE